MGPQSVSGTYKSLLITPLSTCSRFIGEESVAAGIKCDLTDAPTWIIDPVDGTTNFVHRFVSEIYA